MTDAVRLLDTDQVRAALPELRQTLLERLRQPASATELADRLGLTRQKINYHLRVLERAGLIALVEERTRRGFTERIMQATSAAYVVDPEVLGRSSAVASRDRHAATHLVETAAATVREVSRMQSRAAESHKRLLTFTLETQIGFAAPADVHAFTDALSGALAEVVEKYDTKGGRRYRVVVGGHPAPARQGKS